MLHNLRFIFHKFRLIHNFIFFCSNSTFLTNHALKCKYQPVHSNNNLQFIPLFVLLLRSVYTVVYLHNFNLICCITLSHLTL